MIIVASIKKVNAYDKEISMILRGLLKSPKKSKIRINLNELISYGIN